MQHKTFIVEGLSCQGCANSLTNVLTRNPQVQQVNVSYSDNTAEIVTDLSDEAIAQIVSEAGFSVRQTKHV